MGSDHSIFNVFSGLRSAIRPGLEFFASEALIFDPAIPKLLMIL